ncbi:ORF-24 peptide [Chrysodeixis chalcites nucleopolyhedrovirus]|uniref:ORF-24 peptide n=1 Tax=Chrysodeixis chalcites nucleopolyhedrovirus TaxID=320432 RepID=Q4KT56_9ABAC|nr:ORF-24 peptide [Chrysodeixis chalcites nucleopolyhedrovirus]AAY83955.1 ORF-24 peptide [Chrysodeixis chalcites nucleopolyhedrovirus]AGE61286.1 hypothetical protein [Chrysodeixis chalcites nucleopolyhedrovirus]AGE61584.1 hypothetical protein [Chrysodeixis chalcites nucleopolyhedrovirus]AGE61735.1 hypothetical protein [Chrysodeixis chalcites nucleopolyhedrovirus]
MEYLTNHSILNMISVYFESFDDFLNLQTAMQLDHFTFWNLFYPGAIKKNNIYNSQYAMCYFDLLNKPKVFRKYKKYEDKFDLLVTDDDECVGLHLYLQMIDYDYQHQYRKLLPLMHDRQATFDAMYELFCKSVDIEDMFSDVPRKNISDPASERLKYKYPINVCKILTSRATYVIFKGTDLELRVNFKKYPKLLEYIQKLLTFELDPEERCCFVKSLLGNKSKQLCDWHNIFQYYGKSEVLYKAFIKNNVFYKLVFGIEKDIFLQQYIESTNHLGNLRKILKNDFKKLKFNTEVGLDNSFPVLKYVDLYVLNKICLEFKSVEKNTKKKINFLLQNILFMYKSKILLDKKMLKDVKHLTNLAVNRILIYKRVDGYYKDILDYNRNAMIQQFNNTLSKKIDKKINKHYNFNLKVSRKRKLSTCSDI